MNNNGILTLLISILLFSACKQTKQGEEAGDFVSLFKKANLPYVITDTAVLKKEIDSSKISTDVFAKVVPDSVITRIIGKGKMTVYPLASVISDKKEKYLFTKIVSPSKKMALVIVLDKDDNYVAAFPFLEVDNATNTQQVSTLDSRYTISRTVVRKNQDNSTNEGKDVFVLNTDARDFTLIMTDPVDKTVLELINPIDTLARKNKYSADYVKDKKNIVSIRDGERAGKFLFFIHMEKEGCSGELKGFASFTSANKAVYRQGGDPCTLEFTFSSSSVTLNEIEGCGNRRDLRCTFNAKYNKKKEPKTATPKATAK